MSHDLRDHKRAPLCKTSPAETKTAAFVAPLRGKHILSIRKPVEGITLQGEDGALGPSLKSVEEGKSGLCSAPQTRSVIVPATTAQNSARLDATDRFAEVTASPAHDGGKSRGASSLQHNRIPAAESSDIASESTQPQRPWRLDIHAHKYVPLWLKAINESFALIKEIPSLPRFDYADYAHTFFPSFALLSRPQTRLELEACPQYYKTLEPKHYAQYWQERLQNEYAAQIERNYSFSLFNVSIQAMGESLYQLKIPGMRENAPRIDHGDVLHIRQFVSVVETQMKTRALDWYATRDQTHALAPAFMGSEFRVVVWAVSRKDETVLIKAHTDLIPALRCNVIIPLQEAKCVPAWSAVTSLQRPESDDWLRSMLFPDRMDATIQQQLNMIDSRVRWRDPNLNFEQKKAVQAVVSANYGAIPYLISGPPGTGKTRTLVELAMRLLDAESSLPPHLLICAPSDAAADIISHRLAEYLRPGALLRLNHWARASSEAPGSVLPYCFIDSETGLFSVPPFPQMMKCSVVVTTCRDANILRESRLTNVDLAHLTIATTKLTAPTLFRKLDHADLIFWTGLLIDEAAQATEPETLIPIEVIRPLKQSVDEARPLVVLVGDEYQLGPRIAMEKSPTISAAHHDLSTSLFARLFARPLYHDHPLSRANGNRPLTANMLPMLRPPFTNLIRNYRSHSAILSTSSMLFYHDTLIAEANITTSPVLTWEGWPHRMTHAHKPLNTWPVLFHQSSDADNVGEHINEGDGTGSGHLTNHGEAMIALGYARQLLEHTSHTYRPLVQSEVCLISPFSAQVVHMRKLCRDAGLHDVDVGPLEAFQGLEKRVVILCTTRTRLGTSGRAKTHFVEEDKKRHLGVIDEPKRFNVAMTRAEEGLIVIGNAEVLTCTEDSSWAAFLGYCVRNGLCAGEEMPKFTTKSGAENYKGNMERSLRAAEEELQNEWPALGHALYHQYSGYDEQAQSMPTFLAGEYDDDDDNDGEAAIYETYEGHDE